jgi:hypothetical protein
MITDTSTINAIEEHFAGKPDCVKATYEAVIKYLEQLGPLSVEPKKTCLHIVNRTALAGIYPRKGYLQLELKSDYDITDPLIFKSEQISKNRFHHIVRLSSTDAFTEKIAGWIRDAYHLSA